MQKLDKLLQRAAKYQPLYGDRLANHLPMALTALSRLGASDGQLEAFYQAGCRHLQLLGDVGSVMPVDDPSLDLGRHDKFHRYLAFFTDRVEKLGIAELLEQTLPILLPGLSASAFHSMIRLAYGLEAKNETEVAMALAYWCDEYQAFDLPEAKTQASAEEILASLAQVGVRHHFSPGIIVDRMAEIAAVLRRDRVLVQPSEIDLCDIRALAIRAFFANNNFTLLHGVTACHAFRVLQAYVGDREAALEQLWKAILIAYLSTGLDYDTAGGDVVETDCDFSAIVATALDSKDPHVIKLVYSCSQEYLEYRDPIYYQVAKRAVS